MMELAASSLPAVISPVLILILCVAAGLGTVLLLPSRREASIRTIGGVVVLSAAAILAVLLVRSVAAAGDSLGIYFWVFSAIAVLGALRVVTHPRPVYSALYFLLTVFATAGLLVIMYADFMAAALVLIYAGAILVTYVFVIMLAAKAGQGELTDCDRVSREPIIAATIGFGLMALLLIVIFDKGQAIPTSLAADAGSTDTSIRALAKYLFKSQIVNLELAGVILTLAMVGAIVIASRKVESLAAPSLDKPVIGEDNPHAVEIIGTNNPRQKAYPET